MTSTRSDYSPDTEANATMKNAVDALGTIVGVVESLHTPSLKDGRVPQKSDWVRLMPLRDALSKVWTSDAMLVGYRVTTAQGDLGQYPRLSKGAWCRERLNAGGYVVETTMALVDVDIVGATKTPWTDATRAEFDALWNGGHHVLSKAGVYLTRNGFRLFYVLDKPVSTFGEAEAILAQLWIDLRAAGLEASGSFSIDESCKDSVRLMRTPRARKEFGVNLNPAFEDYSRVSPYTPTVPSEEALDGLTVHRPSSRGTVQCGATLPQIPAEWIPAATYMGDVIRVAGSRPNPIGWHRTYLAVSGAFLKLGAAPEAIEAIVAHVVEQDPRWSHLMHARMMDARSTVARWCSGGDVMGLGALSSVFGPAATLTLRSLAPVKDVSPMDIEMVGGAHPTDAPPASAEPRKWEVSDLFCPADHERGKAVMECLRQSAAEYRSVMEERKSTAERVRGQTLHRGCQIAEEKARDILGAIQSMHRDMKLSRVNCRDSHILKERAVRNSKTGRVVVVPVDCRSIHCEHCGPDIIASHLSGAFFGPVRHEESWDLRSMADRTLYVYDVEPKDFQTFTNQYRKAAKASVSSSGWVAFQPTQGNYTVLCDIDMAQPARKGSYVPNLVWVLRDRESILQFVLMCAQNTYSAVTVTEEFKGDLDMEIVGELGTFVRVGGNLASSDSLITRPQTISKHAQVHPWVQAAKSTTKEIVATEAAKLHIENTVRMDPDTQELTEVVVETAGSTMDERQRFELAIEKNEWAAKDKEAELACANMPKRKPVDINAISDSFDALMASYG